MVENICCFIPYHKDYQSIHTINLVLETKPRFYNSFKAEAVYKVHYVCSGSGFLHTREKVYPYRSEIFSSPFRGLRFI